MYDYPENEFVAQFLGSPPINLLSVKLRDDLQTIVLPDTEDTYRLESLVKSHVEINGEFELGVRPEDFYIEPD